jgi:NAD(P)-dependent dehydrogenase (short-subunit alcohol dehydrogenase family)
MIAPTSFKQLNKVAIVTGGGKRLGKAIAIELAKNGFDVVISYLQSKSGARDTVNQINLIGKRGLAVRTDVSIKKQVAHLIA